MGRGFGKMLLLCGAVNNDLQGLADEQGNED
jgi:hypothetical protein